MRSKEKLAKQEPPALQPVPLTREEKLQDILKKVEDKVVTLIDSDAVKIPAHKVHIL